jgi:intracellular sulfur oxidation DsrE/DsrF family protein
MRKRLLSVGMALTVVLAMPVRSRAQSSERLPVPGVAPALDVPNAHEMPDANTDYKVLFDVRSAPPKPTDVNPVLETAARCLNTLAKLGVPASHRHIAVIFHRGGTLVVLTNEEYKARNHGQDNPNIAIVRALKRAGVDLHPCGQAALAMHIAPKDMQPEIQLDLWALTTIVNFEMRGYAHIGG